MIKNNYGVESMSFVLLGRFHPCYTDKTFGTKSVMVFSNDPLPAESKYKLRQPAERWDFCFHCRCLQSTVLRKYWPIIFFGLVHKVSVKFSRNKKREMNTNFGPNKGYVNLLIHT